ncbi:MAG: helix-turn-helix transcriptional regulator [Firmicutes bacterium]|nr:helix-turn-helix transcriptional regulator [Bacillota bacterium]
MKALCIRQERIKRGWPQEYVGQQVGITNQAVNLLETAQRDPSYKVLCKLEDLFNLNHRQLFAVADGENNPLPK